MRCVAVAQACAALARSGTAPAVPQLRERRLCTGLAVRLKRT